MAPAARERVITELSEHYSRDELSLEEFERRVSEVYTAETADALAALVDDLPTSPDAAGPPGAPMSASSASVPTLPTRISTVLGSVQRSDLVAVPRFLYVRAVLGHIELDLRNARFEPGVTQMRLRPVMGNIEIRLPPHVRVENEGKSVLSSFECHEGQGTSSHGDAPPSVVRITGKAVLSSVSVNLPG